MTDQIIRQCADQIGALHGHVAHLFLFCFIAMVDFWQLGGCADLVEDQ